MTVKTNQWDITLSAGETGRLNLDFDSQVNEATMRTMTTFFITAEGLGSVDVVPIIQGDAATTLEAFNFSNDSGHLDFTGAIDLQLTETGGANPVTVRISSTRAE